MSRPSRVLAAGSNWLAFAATLAVAFLLTPHLIRALGPGRYDVWCVVEAILAYFTLLDLGVGAFLVRATARATATNESDRLNRVCSASLAIFSGAGLVAVVIGTPVALFMGPRLGDRVGDPADATAFMVVMLANLALSLPLSVFPSILDGLERFTAKSAVKVIALAAKAAGYLVVTWDGGTLLPLAVVSIVVALAESLALAALCFWYLPSLRFSPGLIDRATLRDVRGYSTDAFLAMLAGRISLQTGSILIGLFLPTGHVTAFATAARLVDYAKTLLRTVTTTLTPGIAAMEAKGDRDGVRRLFLTGTRVVLFLVMPVNVGVLLFGEPFLRRWVGAEVALGSYPALVVLSLTLSIGVAQSMAGRVMYGLGHLKWYARLALLEAAVNALLTVVLIRPYGVVGVAVAVALPNLIFCVVTIAMACRATGTTRQDYLATWLNPLLAVMVPVVIWVTLGPVEPTWPAVFGGVAMGLGPYAIAVLALASVGRVKALRRPDVALVPSKIDCVTLKRPPVGSSSQSLLESTYENH
jgi:O-antigen/teichoic acid export membrane protein